MRIALVHNPDAGQGAYDADDLARLFRDRGYDVAVHGRSKKQVARAAESRPDVLVAAGGDGTVARVAIALAGTTIPLLILPVGTANNIARSLGIQATVPVLIDGLTSARQVRLDIGQVSAPWGEESFVEGAGVGFIGAMLRNEGSMRERLGRFLWNLVPSQKRPHGVARLIRRHPIRTYHMVADGSDLSGDYVTVEAMNIRAIGPRIALAPNADLADGHLDLVLVRPEDRDPLAEYVALEAPGLSPPVEIRRVRRAEMTWIAGYGHVDDEPWPLRAESTRGADGAMVSVSLGRTVNVLIV
ncbi:MAG: diacylglycerol kinase family protein [Gemmatimonadaceae bacterium]